MEGLGLRGVLGDELLAFEGSGFRAQGFASDSGSWLRDAGV